MKWSYTNILLVLVAFLLVMCLDIDSIEYPETVVANEEATFRMKVIVDAAENSNDVRLVIGYLVPKSWNAKANTHVSYTSNVDEGVLTMSLVPETNLPKNGGGVTWSQGIKAKYGFGPNVLDDMEWVAYWSDKVYNVANGEDIIGNIELKTLVAAGNLKVKLGFFVNHTNDGLGGADHYEAEFSDCITVINGVGDVIDFCELHFNSVQPLTATEDDIITLRYQGDVGENALDGIDDIYLCSTAITDQGNVYTVCDKEPASKMKKESTFGRTFSLTVWPVGYYGIQQGEKIQRIEYSFSNSDGTIVVQQTEEGMPDSPYLYSFKCD